MMMSTEHGFAFLCMPKCASTSIESALEPHCNIVISGHPRMKHMNASMFSKTMLYAHRQVLSKYPMESFCLIRNPREWIESWYRFRTRKGISRSQAKDHRYFTGNLSFAEFVTEFLKGQGRAPWANVPRQSDFLSMPDGRIGVDRIFPMEDLSGVEVFLSERLGQPIELPAKNVSPKTVAELDDELELALQQFLERDRLIYEFVVEQWGYRKSRDRDALHALLAQH